MKPGRAIASAVALVTMGHGVPVHAADAPLRVRLAVARAEGAGSCADTPRVMADVVRRLGRDPFDPAAERSIDTVFSREATRWSARIIVRAPAGEQSVESVRVLASDATTCAPLGNQVALAVALAIDPDAPLAPLASLPPVVPATEPRPIARSPSQSPAVPRDASAPSDRRAVPRADRATVALHAGAVIGALPVPASAIALVTDSRRFGSWHVSIGALRTMEVRTADRSFGFGFTALSISGCYGWTAGRIAADVCAGARAGLTHAVVHPSEALVPVRPGDYFWLGIVGTGRVSLEVLGPVAIEVGLSPTLALYRQRFIEEGTGRVVFEQSIAGLDAWGGVRVRLW